MSAKLTGLAAFTKRGTQEADLAPPARLVSLKAGQGSARAGKALGEARQRAKKDVVALTVRLQRAEWERLHQLAVSEGMSIQALAVQGLNRVFTEKGLPQLAEAN